MFAMRQAESLTMLRPVDAEERKRRRGAALRRLRESAGVTLHEAGILSRINAVKIKAAEAGQEELSKQEEAAVETALLRLLEEHARTVTRAVEIARMA